MKILQLLEEPMDAARPEKCQLLLEVTSKKVTYAVVDEGEQVIALAEISAQPGELAEMLASAPALNYTYLRVKASIATEKFTFIPQAIFAADQVDDYLRFVQPDNRSEVLTSTLPGFEIKNVVAVSSETLQTIQRRFPNAWIGSQIDPFIRGIQRQHRAEETAWFFNFKTGDFEAALVKNGELLFYNLFKAADPDEFNYFLLLLLKQFPLSNTNPRAVASGAINVGDPSFKRLQKYFPKIELASLSPVKVAAAQNISLHHYFSLLHLTLCE